MNNVLTIYEAKTNLSKYIKRVKAGESFYIGSRGSNEALLTSVSKKRSVKYGVASNNIKYIGDTDFTKKDLDKLFGRGSY
jgi:prevent-host-death family protein